MRALTCPSCATRVFFENDVCLSCNSAIGFDPTSLSMVLSGDNSQWLPCANQAIAACNWVVRSGDVETLCASCRLTRTRPDDGDSEAEAWFCEAEAAKRRLVAQLIDLGLEIVAHDEAPDGLGFDLLSSRDSEVMIGHQDGLITLDLAEADDAHRERVRAELAEPYRTMLGHLRHEVGHYYWNVLVRDAGRSVEFRTRFGDERADYQQAVSAHYEQATPQGWQESYVSAYATMHPWEDWAETFAHYLHLRDTLQTAAQFGLWAGDGVVQDHSIGDLDEGALERWPFAQMAHEWIVLSAALNAINRSMGAGDLYPFVLAEAVVDKLAWIDRLVRSPASAEPGTALA